MTNNAPESDLRYEPPAIELLGSVRGLTAQKSGEEPDGLKGQGEIDFPSPLEPPH